MPRWPSQQTENQEQEKPPAPPASPEPPKSSYNYKELNTDDAETRSGPYNGETVIVSNSPDYIGCAARWRATRHLKGWRWVKTGAWVTPLYNFSVPFEPLYWRRVSNLEDSEN